MARFTRFVLGALLSSVAVALPSNVPRDIGLSGYAKRQYNQPSQEDRAQAVIEAFRFSWEGYSKYAFPNDDLKPVSNGFTNSR